MTRFMIVAAALVIAAPASAQSLFGTSSTASYDPDNATRIAQEETQPAPRAIEPATVRTTTTLTPTGTAAQTEIRTSDYNTNYDSAGNPTYLGDYQFKLD